MNEIQAWVESHFSKIREDFFTLLRFKTISSDSSSDPLPCTEWLKKQFESLQCKAEIIPTAGWPLVYAEDLRAGPKAPTLLIYGHYDVVSVDPIELWKTDPFEPVEKNGHVFARGAQDNKGQLFYVMTALRALRETHRKIAVNLKFCIEGEEEMGSKGLCGAIASLKQKLRADSLLIADFGIASVDRPSINLGARGIVSLEVVLRGSKSDLHSGSFGGIAYNPNRALAELLASCWDENGRVRVPHFYDEVQEMTAAEKALFSNQCEEGEITGIGAFSNEKGYSLHESNCLRPTLEINGMAGGYAGPGFKTVIPELARAKISCRLVPNQDPEKIGRLVADFLKKGAKKGMEVEIDVHEGGRAYRGRSDSKLAKAVSLAYEEVCGKPCEKMLSGGSIPVIAQMLEAIPADVVGMGYGLSGDGIHAPNENFGLDRFKKGILTVARAIELLGTL